MKNLDKFNSVFVRECEIPDTQKANLQSYPFATDGITMHSDNEEANDHNQTPPNDHNSNTHDAVNDENLRWVFYEENEARKVDVRHVFVEMSEKENEASTSGASSTSLKRKLPLSMEKEVEGDENVYVKRDAFLVMINRVAKLSEREGNKGGGEGGEHKGVDFLETAKKRGVTFPRPRWRSPETWKG